VGQNTKKNRRENMTEERKIENKRRTEIEARKEEEE
jgi:hypothetical protein